MEDSITFFFQVSSMGITPFFVENVSELQLCAIKLVTAVGFYFFPLNVSYILFCLLTYIHKDWLHNYFLSSGFLTLWEASAAYLGGDLYISGQTTNKQTLPQEFQVHPFVS